MIGNPYHEPLTAAAIYHVAHVAAISPETKQTLLRCVEGVPDQVGQFGGLMLDRSLEIVLSRVKTHEGMRRELMGSLVMLREEMAQIRGRR